MKQLALLLATHLMLSATPCLADGPPVFLLQFGSRGSGDGQFQNLAGIGVGTDGDIYVADRALDRVSRFSPDGVFRCVVGTVGTGDAEFDNCFDVAFGSDNLAYVADALNGRVQVFDTNCNYLRQWSLGGGSVGHVAIDPILNHVYTTTSRYVRTFDTNGTSLGSWPYLGHDPSGPEPFGLGPSGLLYFPDESGSRILVYSPNGGLVRSWGTPGDSAGQLGSPAIVATDSHENVYVMDGFSRVQKFTSTGHH